MLFICAEFQSNQINHLCSIAIFAKCIKRKKKINGLVTCLKSEAKTQLGHPFNGDFLKVDNAISIKFGVYVVGELYYKMMQCEKGSLSCVSIKIDFCSCNIPTV